MIQPPDGPPQNPEAERLLALAITERRLPRNAIQRVFVATARRCNAHTPTPLKALSIASDAGVDEKEVLRHWTALVAAGCLIEHARDRKNDWRQFTVGAVARAA